MRVAALSLAGIRTDRLDHYREDITGILKELDVKLAVLPAYTALLLCRSTGTLGEAPDFNSAFKLFREKCGQWNGAYLKLHGSLAGELGIHLVAGTTLERAGDHFYHTAYCFDSGGGVCAFQRQTHLNREERELGLSRGTELDLVDLNGIKLGMVIGTDARHPEVGRILAFRGADILIHTGALEAGSNNTQQQLAGMWAQVQQNECWAVEAQLHANISGRNFCARSAVIGPCVASEDLSGYLALAAGGERAAAAQLNQEDRRRARESFPVLRQINPGAYRGDLY